MLVQFYTNLNDDMTVSYLKDVSLLILLVTAVRVVNTEIHLQAEQQSSFLLFAFNHQNYSIYNTYQYLY